MSSPRISLSHTAHWLLTAVLLFFGVLAVVQPSGYLSLFTSSAVYFVCFAGIVLLYFLLREDRA